MAKNTSSKPQSRLDELLATMTLLPAVYDAKDFCNRPFTFDGVDWQVFDASERNNFNTVEKAKISATEISTGKKVLLETTQKGITEIIGAMENAGLFGEPIMIVQEGKFCTIRSA